MTTIYVVTEGTYSDYSIVALCSTPEKAEVVRLATEYPDEARIEKWEIDGYPSEVDRGLTLFRVEMWRDGHLDVGRVGHGRLARPTVALRSSRNTHLTRIFAILWARDKEHAAKIINEKRVQMIANGEWPD